MNSTPHAFFSVIDLHTYYGDSYVLQGVNLKAEQGEVLAVLGRNGVGKTTLAKSIMGFVASRQGTIHLNGIDLTHKTPEARCREGIALVPQGRRTFKSLSVAETLDLASHLRGHDQKGLSWTSAEVYEAFPRLAERRNNRAGTLSGGEQQMLAVGRALVGNPEVLVLDEPTEGLSPLLVRELHTVLQLVKSRGSTVILIEQRVKFALALADRVALISKGQVVFESTPEALDEAEDIKQRYLGV